ncbi:hypothetical protein PG988_016125 [Apiospora saccharicola]
MYSLTTLSPTQKDWDHHRSLLIKLYVDENKSVQEIMAFMEKTYSFTAPKHQYNKHLNTRWKCVKYGSSRTWKAILPHVRRLETSGKGVEVFIDMKRKSVQEVRNAMARYKGTLQNTHITEDLPILPDNVIVRAATQPMTVAITPQLPFYVMESQLTLNFQSSICYRSQAMRQLSQDIQVDNHLSETLRAVVPPEQTDAYSFNSPLVCSKDSLFTSPFHRALLFSIANNFAGLPKMYHDFILGFLKEHTTVGFLAALADAKDLYEVQSITLHLARLPNEGVLDFLKGETTRELILSLADSEGTREAQDLAKRLFRMALETGDHEMVNYILDQRLACIDINESILGSEPANNYVGWDPELCKGFSKKPIEIASERSHIEVVRTLIEFGAQVKSTAALYNALSDYKLPAEIIDLLMSAGAELSVQELCQITRWCRRDFILGPILQHIAANHQQWNKDEVLVSTLLHQPFNVCYQVLEALEAYGADLNAVMTTSAKLDSQWPSEPWCGTIPEALSTTRHWKNFPTLFKRFPKMRITERMVLGVVRTAVNVDQVRRLLALGPDINDSKYRNLLIEHAAVEGDIEVGLVAVLECLPPCSTEDVDHLRESVVIAALTGNVEQIHALFHLAEKEFGRRPSELPPGPGRDNSWVIYMSIRAGQLTAALALIEVGWAKDSEGSVMALELAICQKYSTVVTALIDAGVVASDHVFMNGKTLLSTALGDGDTRLAQVLLNAGASVNLGTPLPLFLALKSKDWEMAKLLLYHGADINHKVLRYDRQSLTNLTRYTTALSIAIETLDPKLVQFVLEHGAETDDGESIQLAAKAGHDIFRLVVNEYKRRHRGRKDWGDMILRVCLENHDLENFREMVTSQMADVNCYLWDRLERPDRDEDYRGAITVFGEVILKSKHTGLEFLELLLQYKEKLDCWPDTVVIQNRHGGWSQQTAFIAAIGTGHLPTVQMFVRHNAGLGLPKGIVAKRTPLQNAVETGNMEIIQLLLDRGAPVNAPAVYNEVDAPAAKVNGVTALEGAAQHGRIDTASLLLDAGACSHGNDKNQLDRAIRLAREEGHEPLARMLEDFSQKGVLSSGRDFFPEFVDFNNY